MGISDFSPVATLNLVQAPPLPQDMLAHARGCFWTQRGSTGTLLSTLFLGLSQPLSPGVFHATAWGLPSLLKVPCPSVPPWGPSPVWSPGLLFARSSGGGQPPSRPAAASTPKQAATCTDSITNGCSRGPGPPTTTIFRKAQIPPPMPRGCEQPTPSLMHPPPPDLSSENEGPPCPVLGWFPH